MRLIFLAIVTFISSVVLGSELIARTQWPNNNKPIQVDVYEQYFYDVFESKKIKESKRVISFLKVDGDILKEIASFDYMDHLLSVWTSSDDDSLLYTVWVTGSAYRLRAFTFKDDAIKLALDHGSKNFPTIMPTPSGNVLILFLMDNILGEVTLCHYHAYVWDGNNAELKENDSCVDR